MTNKPKTAYVRSLISKRRMEEAADMWLDFFGEAYMLLIGEGRDKLTLEEIEQISEKAKQVADAGLDCYQNRWPGL